MWLAPENCTKLLYKVWQLHEDLFHGGFISLEYEFKHVFLDLYEPLINSASIKSKKQFKLKDYPLKHDLILLERTRRPNRILKKV